MPIPGLPYPGDPAFAQLPPELQMLIMQMMGGQGGPPMMGGAPGQMPGAMPGGMPGQMPGAMGGLGAFAQLLGPQAQPPLPIPNRVL